MTSNDSLAQKRELVSRVFAEYAAKRLAYYRDRRDLLTDLLKKNPLLPALRGITTASGWVQEALHAHESSSEETIMGNAWQDILTQLADHAVGAGDLLIERDDRLWVVEIKSQINTLNSSSLPQTLRGLQRKVNEQRRVRTPRSRGVDAMIGVVNGSSLDEFKTFPDTADENRDIANFPYRYMVGAAFKSWLTGMANPDELMESANERSAEIAAAREACLERLRGELSVLLTLRNLPDSIESVMLLRKELGYA